MTGYAILGCATNVTLVVLSRIPTGLCKHTLDLIKLFVTESSSVKERPVMLGKLNASASLGFMLGPLLGGYIGAQSNGFVWTARVTTTLFLLNAFLLHFFVQPSRTRPSSVPIASMIKMQTGTYHAKVVTHGMPRTMLLVRGCMALSAVVFRSHWMLILERKFGMDVMQRGYLLGYMGCANTVASAAVGPLVRRYVSCDNSIMSNTY